MAIISWGSATALGGIKTSTGKYDGIEFRSWIDVKVTSTTDTTTATITAGAMVHTSLNVSNAGCSYILAGTGQTSKTATDSWRYLNNSDNNTTTTNKKQAISVTWSWARGTSDASKTVSMSVWNDYNSNCKWGSASAPSTASYTIKVPALAKYTLTANANGGTISSTSGWSGTGSKATKTVQYKSSYSTLPSLSRTGYTFGGWYTAASGGTQVTASTKMAAQDTTIYAHWTINTYTLTAYANGGSISATSGWTGTGDSATKKINYQVAYGTLPTVTREGYELIEGGEWKTSSGTRVTSASLMGAGAAPIYAQWEKKTFTITYNANGGSGTIEPGTQIYNEGYEIVNGTGFTKHGYSFKNWNTNANGSGTTYYAGDIYKKNTNETLYAIWEENDYTITYYMDDSTPSSSKTQTKKYTQTIKLLGKDAFEEDYYHIASWNTKVDGTGDSYDLESDYSGEALILYAQWVANTITINYDYDNGSAISISSYSYPNSITLSTYNGKSKTGYHYLKRPNQEESIFIWKDDTGEQYFAGSTLTWDADLDEKVYNLKALWEPNEYTIVFNNNAEKADGRMNNMELDYDVSGSLSKNEFTRTGYNFIGWNTEEDGTGTSYADEEIVDNLVSSGSITLYAQWELIIHWPEIIDVSADRGTGYDRDGVGEDLNGLVIYRRGYWYNEESTETDKNVYFHLSLDDSSDNYIVERYDTEITHRKPLELTNPEEYDQSGLYSFLFTEENPPEIPLDQGKEYEVHLKLKASYATTTKIYPETGEYSFILQRAQFIIDINASGNSIGFGGVVEDNDRHGAYFYNDGMIYLLLDPNVVGNPATAASVDAAIYNAIGSNGLNWTQTIYNSETNDTAVITETETE